MGQKSLNKTPGIVNNEHEQKLDEYLVMFSKAT